MTTRTDLEAAAAHLDATEWDADTHAYYDKATRTYYRVSNGALAALGELLRDDDPDIRRDALSHWCAGAGSDAEPMDEWGDPAFHIDDPNALDGFGERSDESKLAVAKQLQEFMFDCHDLPVACSGPEWHLVERIIEAFDGRPDRGDGWADADDRIQNGACAALPAAIYEALGIRVRATVSVARS